MVVEILNFLFIAKQFEILICKKLNKIGAQEEGVVTKFLTKNEH